MLKKNEGRVIFIVLFFVPAVFLFLGLVVNISYLVNEKIKLQIMADASAFSGAAVQHRGLNYTKEMNMYLWKNTSNNGSYNWGALDKTVRYLGMSASYKLTVRYIQSKVTSYFNEYKPDQVSRSYAKRAPKTAETIFKILLPKYT